jgi:hypothetical protein
MAPGLIDVIAASSGPVLVTGDLGGAVMTARVKGYGHLRDLMDGVPARLLLRGWDGAAAGFPA